MNKKEFSMKVFLIVAKAIVSDAKKEIRANTAIDALRTYNLDTDVAVQAVKEMIDAGLLSVRKHGDKKFVSLTKKACDIIREYNKNKKEVQTMKKVQVKNLKDEIIEIVEVKEVPQCFCGKEMFVLEYGHDRMWNCTCMSELIYKCRGCGEWVYEDMCYPEDFDDTLEFTFYYGHRHCMKKKAKEIKENRKKVSK